MNTADRGCLTEIILQAELLKRCCVVLKPLHSHARYDLVVEIDGRFQRAQCKTGRFENGRVTFNTHSIQWQKGRVARHRDYRGDVDIFLIHCYENGQSYLVPADKIGTTSCSLRVEPTKNKQSKNVMWATDYRL